MSDHCHVHTPVANSQKAQKALTLVLSLTTLFFFVEVVGGFWTGSIALLSDAGHMFTDIAALSFSLFAVYVSQRKATTFKTYGFHRFETLAAFINAAFLMIVSASLFLESFARLQNPHSIEALPMTMIAIIGFFVNLFGFFILLRHQENNLNIRGALLHVFGDLLGSVGAIIAGVLIWFTNWTIADPIVSIFICVLILISSWNLLWKSIHVLMEGTPDGICQEKLRQAMCHIQGVQDICDLHIWSLNSDIPMLTAHVIVQDIHQYKDILLQLKELLKTDFQIEHVTLQLEDSSFPSCGLII